MEARPDASDDLLIRTLESFRQALLIGQAGLFIRHAEREDITHPAGTIKAPLTDRGRAVSRDLGVALGTLLGPDRRLLLFHSFVPRCEQTAAAIADGVESTGASLAIGGVLDVLAGPYLLDARRAVALTLESTVDFVRHWFDGQLPEGIVKPRSETAREQLQGIVAALDAHLDHDAVFVSHDTNLLAVREEYLGMRWEEAGWVDYLDGVAVGLGPDGPTVIHGDRRAVVRPSSLVTPV